MKKKCHHSHKANRLSPLSYLSSNLKIIKYKSMNKLLLLLFCQIFSLSIVYCQEKEESDKDVFENPLKSGLKYNFTEDGKYSMKLGFGSHLWARYTFLNPNTYDYDGEEIDSHLDFLNRRTFIKVQANMDRLFFLAVLGVKSQTQLESYGSFTTNKPEFYFYDVFANYSFFNRHLYVGYGLHLYQGLSRYASASSATTLGADVPMLPGTNVVTTEQLARSLGFFADGMAGIFGYRLVVISPFITNSESKPTPGINKAVDTANTNLKTEGYFTLQFWDKELAPVPFTTATYLGKKKVFNIGVGFKYHPGSTASISTSGDTVLHDQLHLAADIFMDLPLSNGSAVTLYGSYFIFDFGPNYLLNGSVGNTFKSTSPTGAGNVEPLVGTGTGVSTQLAWLLPYKIGLTGKLQPYYEGDYRMYDALDDVALHHNMGVNYYVLDNNFKFTLQHELRPYFEDGKHKSNKSLFIFKVQVYI